MHLFSLKLEQAWRIFTPVLKEIEEKGIKPIKYEFGSRGPKEADELARKYGYLSKSLSSFPMISKHHL